MTVGIGLLCQSVKYILLAADMRASYGEPPMTVNDQCGKLFDLPHNFCGAISGSISWCEVVISQLAFLMTNLPVDQRGVSYIRNTIKEAIFHAFKAAADEQLRPKLGLTLEEYKHDVNLRFDCEPATPGIAVIGSGATAALSWLNYRDQGISMSVSRSIFHLTEAKQFAEVSPTVGPLRQMIILWAGGWKGLEGEPGQELIQGLWNRYGLPQSVGLDDAKYAESFRQRFGLSSIP